MPVKGSGWSRPFDGIEGQEGREEATCPYFQSGGCPGGEWTSHLPLGKTQFSDDRSVSKGPTQAE